MKKVISVILFVSTGFFAIAQNWTDTLVHPRNVVMEEFTGIYCGACPAGHDVAHKIDSANPGRVIIIGVHASDTYSQPNNSSHPDFRTQWGSNLYSMSNCWYFPTAMINRSVFDSATCSNNAPGSSKGMTRGSWEEASNEILADDSADANIGVRSLWDESTRTLSIDVELYYHKEQNLFNKLNIALTEGNIIAYQSNDNDYVHKHVLRELITAIEANSWSGVKVDDIVVGQWQTFHFDYIVPADYNGVPVNIDNCELAVYLTGWSNTPISTGVSIHAKNDSTNAPSNASDIEEISLLKNHKVYPNPSEGSVFFSIPTNTNGEIHLWDFLGSSIIKQSINGKITKLDTENLKAGVYIYTINNGNEISNGKLIIR